jgi:oligopeptide/dipeptide ABC transporter ATP-binding protein
MYMGTMVEYAPAPRIFADRLHPYTKALLAAVPIPVLGGKKERRLIRGEITSPVNPKPGCRFAKRCEYATDICSVEDPVFVEAKAGHFVACHNVKAINRLL